VVINSIVIVFTKMVNHPTFTDFGDEEKTRR